MARSTPVGEAVAVVDSALDLLEAALRDAASDLTRDEWLEVVGGAQGLVNRLTAEQDLAIAWAARREGVWNEDGTTGEVDRGPGRVALDAADLVAPGLGVSHHQAQRRVETAVRLSGRDPVPVDTDARPDRNGLDGLHAAMRDGRLDAHRASVVADELLEAPADVAEAVVAALEPHLASEPAPALRRRTRRLLARVSPDLLRQRAQRSRRDTGLRRWVAEPGVDAWYGTFPTEQSAAAWAAIDGLARQYLADGVCDTIEQARGRALTDLVLEHSDVRVQLVLTHPVETDAEPAVGPGPASAVPEPSRATGAGAVHVDDDLVQVHGVRPSEPMLVERRWLERLAADATTDVVEQPCDPGTGARVDPADRLARDGYRPGEPLTALVRARDGRCRFPGCSVAARFCDLDHVRPWPTGPTAATNLLCLCRRHHRIKQAPGWMLRLRPDGVAEWADPTGRVRTSAPLDALERLVLPAEPPVSPSTAHLPPTTAGGELPSVLEEAHARRIDEHRAVVEHRRCARPRAVPLDRRRRRIDRFGGEPPF